MKRRTRRILFWFAVILFGAFSYLAVLTAQGYKYDFGKGQFVRTGAVSVQTNTDADLFLDDRLVDHTSLLSHRAGQSRLLPGGHTVRLVKDDYSIWRKTVQVQEGLLTDFPNVLLLPMTEESVLGLRQEASQSLAFGRTLANATPTPSASPKPKVAGPRRVTDSGFALVDSSLYRMDTASGSLIADKVLGFAPIDNGNRVLWWTRNDVWVLWARNTDYQPFHAEDDREMITRFSVPIIRAAWFRGRDHIIVDLGSGGYRVLEIDTRGGVNIIKI